MHATEDISPDLDAKQRKQEELRSVIRMSVPIVVTICSRMVMDLADFYMISCMDVGAREAQGAILPAQVTMWTFIVIGFGTVNILNSFVSQSLGRKKYLDTTAYAWQGFYLSIIFGAIGVAASPLLPYVLRSGLMNHSPEILEQELIYTRISVLTIGPTVAAEALACYFNGAHRPTVSMWSAIEANLLNAVISATLIFGWLGFPAMGIAGAAWGTVIGTTYRVIRLMISFVGRRNAEQFGARVTWRFSLEKSLRILRVGFPQGLQWFSDVFVWMIFISCLVARFGDDHLIATNIGWQYMRISFLPTVGIGVALSALVGKSVGKGDHEQAIRFTRLTVTIIIAYMGTLTVVYFFFRESLIAIWNSDPAIVKIGSSVLICAAVFQLFDGLSVNYNSALRGAGDTFWPAALFVISHWLIVVGGGLLVATFRPEWKSLGPWWAATLLIIFIGIALWWRWSSGAWKKMDIFKKIGGDGEENSDGDLAINAEPHEDQAMNQSSPLKLAVLVSGGGRSLLNIHDQIEAGQLNASIEIVICSRSNAAALQRSRDAGLRTEVVDRRENEGDSFHNRIADLLHHANVDLVCLAGFFSFWKIPDDFLGRVINIHPALLPDFGGRGYYGDRVHRAVLDAGAKISGCTVHFADNEYDHGPTILQLEVPVLSDDTVETLQKRVFEKELIAYPEVIRRCISGEVKLPGPVHSNSAG